MESPITVLLSDDDLLLVIELPYDETLRHLKKYCMKMTTEKAVNASSEKRHTLWSINELAFMEEFYTFLIHAGVRVHKKADCIDLFYDEQQVYKWYLEGEEFRGKKH